MKTTLICECTIVRDYCRILYRRQKLWPQGTLLSALRRWLAPGQQIADEDGGAWPHGAFVYLYAEAAAHLDCFFAADLRRA